MAVFGKETFKIKGMIASQRSAHKFIWLGMAVAVPILLFFTISTLDFSVAEISQKEQVTVQKVGSNIEIQLNRPFVSPSAVVYELSSSGTSKILGQLQGVGDYSFEATSEAIGILIKDEIKKKELLKVEF